MATPSYRQIKLTLQWTSLFAGIFMTMLAQPSYSADYYVINLQSQQGVDVYFQINASGKVYLRIENREGTACAKLWWIKWPLGNVEQLGEHCGLVQLDIPSLPNISSKLRASGDTSTKILVTADERVANTISIPWD
jgi:hypothetical protein